MEPMSYAKARSVITLYNEYRCARTVSRELKLPYQDCFALVDWLWNQAHGRQQVFSKNLPASQTQLPDLTKRTWLEHLYSRNVTPEAAADSVGWHVNEVLRTCHGPRQWHRTKNRLPLHPPRPCRAESEPTENDISEEEIYRRAMELRMQRPETQQETKPARVEAQHFSFNR